MEGQASSGLHFYLCVDAQGTVWGFGTNNDSQLGIRNEYDRPYKIPTRIPRLTKILAVACGSYHSVCVNTSGYVFSFGRNDDGQLGLGDYNKHTEINQIQSLPKICYVACGCHNTFCIDENQGVWSFGRNTYGQLGPGESGSRNFPLKTLLSGVRAVSAGLQHAAFLLNNGYVIMSGSNDKGQLGIEQIGGNFVAVTLKDHPNISQIACGYRHTLLLQQSGTVYSYGDNSSGCLGLGDEIPRSSPTLVEVLPCIQYISCSLHSSLCLDYDNKLWAFGSACTDKLQSVTKKQGVGYSPYPITEIENVCVISRGGWGNFVVRDDEKIWLLDGSYSQIARTEHHVCLDKGFSDIVHGIPLNHRAKSARK
mmetsp:Transcript_4016/g.4985  ORF Transcript_4016/g.4985 Transcript_4016/m.4985 type:complete len:366 (-) Transcript_4016:278-1375(-)